MGKQEYIRTSGPEYSKAVWTQRGWMTEDSTKEYTEQGCRGTEGIKDFVEQGGLSIQESESRAMNEGNDETNL